MRKFIDIIAESMDVTDTIQQEISKTGMEPEEINDGFCDHFAMKVVEALGGRTDTTFDADTRDQLDLERVGQTYDPTATLHVFVCHDGRVYDAENPEGVDRWQDLAYYRRHSW